SPTGAGGARGGARTDARRRRHEEGDGYGRTCADRGVRPRAGGEALHGGAAGVTIAYSSRRFAFAARHRYWGDGWWAEEYERFFGRLTVPHGHNYQLEVTVRGPIDPETGMVINLTEL